MLNKISFFRLQPIVKISKGEFSVYAHEVLLRPSDLNDVNLESFFDSLSIFSFKKLFMIQFSIFSNRDGFYFINVPTQLFLSNGFVSKHALSKRNNINIEIQNPNLLLDLDEFELAIIRNEILILQNNGVKVWLDDIDDKFLDIAIYLGVDGVKLDKYFVWSELSILELANSFRSFGIDVLAEGVENNIHLNKIFSSNINLAQGFFWPEMLVNFD